ncbi:MAG: hypothetical protein QXF86_03205 [Candidatus Bilamarchaeaceae archaeon]
MKEKGYEKEIIEVRFYKEETKKVREMRENGEVAQFETLPNHRYIIHLTPHISIVELFHEIGHYLELHARASGINLRNHELPFFLEDYAIRLIRKHLYREEE